MNESGATISAADVWHGRLKQFSHRAGALGCLIFLAGLYGKHGIDAPFCVAFSIYCGIIGSVCAVFAWWFISPEDGDIREALGVFLFCMALTLGAWLTAWLRGYEVYVPYLAEWLLFRFEFLGEKLVSLAAWGLRVTTALLAVWICVTTALTRKGQE